MVRFSQLLRPQSGPLPQRGRQGTPAVCDQRLSILCSRSKSERINKFYSAPQGLSRGIRLFSACEASLAFPFGEGSPFVLRMGDEVPIWRIRIVFAEQAFLCKKNRRKGGSLGNIFYQITIRSAGAMYILSVSFTSKAVYHSVKFLGVMLARRIAGP